MKRPSKSEVVFSIRAFVAGMLALYLAMSLGLPRPFWALLTAYVASQTFAGAARSKAAFRFVGTILGAACALMLTPHLVNYTALFVLAMCAWFGGCLYISLQDRSPRAYIFILAAYTPLIIAFPALANATSFDATTIFNISLARVEEIFVGTACAALVHSVIMPNDIAPVIRNRIETSIKDGVAWMRHVFKNEEQKTLEFDQGKLSQDITELRMLSTHLPFDTSNLKWATGSVIAIQHRLSAMLLYTTTIEKNLNLLRENNQDKTIAIWQPIFNRILSWAEGGVSSPQVLVQLHQEITVAIPEIDECATWTQILEVNMASHLRQLIEALEKCFYQQEQVALSIARRQTNSKDNEQRAPQKTAYIDRGQAALTALAAALAVGVSTTFWVLSGWPLGFSAPMMTGLFCAFFASLDNPVPVLKVSAIYTSFSTPIAGIYLLYLLPSTHSFEMIMLVLAPFLLISGIYLSRPTTVLYAIPICFTTLASFMMIDMGVSDVTSFANSQISQMIGVCSAAIFMSLFRNVDANRLAARVLNLMGSEISDLAKAAKPPALTAVTAKMVDRISVLIPRLANNPTQGKSLTRVALQDMRVELNMVHLLRVRNRLQRREVTIQPILNGLSEHYMKSHENRQGSLALMTEIDRVLRHICCMPAFPMRNESIAALGGIRRDLYPDSLYKPAKEKGK